VLIFLSYYVENVDLTEDVDYYYEDDEEQATVVDISGNNIDVQHISTVELPKQSLERIEKQQLSIHDEIRNAEAIYKDPIQRLKALRELVKKNRNDVEHRYKDKIKSRSTSNSVESDAATDKKR
jgi:hypothetical protein